MLFFFPALSFGQYLNIFDIETDEYPYVTAKFIYEKSDNERSLSKSSIDIKENDEPAELISLQLPKRDQLNSLSVVLVFDVSSSMIGKRIEIAKKAGRSFIEMMDMEQSECAITSFDHLNYLNCDFTTDKKELTDKLNSISARGGTNYNAAFLMPFAGAMEIAKGGKNKKVVILMTDGKGEGNEDKIIQLANQENVTVFPVAVELEIPDILKNIANQTGGKYYSNVRTIQEAQDIYNEIFVRAKSESFGEMVWESPSACQSLVNLTINANNLSDTLNYHIPEKYITRLHADSYFMVFEDDSLDNSKKVSLQAMNSDFEIEDVSMQDETEKYTLITEKDIPFMLKKNQKTDITLNKMSNEEGPGFTKFTINTDKCSDVKIYIRDSHVSESETPLSLVAPNGGEVFSVGVDTELQWDGIEKVDSVQLYYSANQGKDWSFIEKSTGLNTKWKIPAQVGKKNLVKVTQETKSEGSANIIDLTSLYDKNYSAHNATLSADGTFIITSEKDYTIKLWDAETGRFIQEFKFHDELVYNAKSNSDEELLVSASKDGTARIFSLNTGVLENILNINYWGINKAIFDKEDKSIVTASDDGVIRFWNVESGELEGSVKSHLGWVMDIDISPDNQLLASAGDDNIVRIWDLSRKTHLKALKVHRDLVYSVAFSPDGKYVASSSKDGTFAVWDVDKGKLVSRNNDHHRRVYTTRFSPDGNYLVTTSRDGTACIWELKTGTLLDKIFAGEGNWFRNAEFGHRGQRLLTVDNKGKVRIQLISKIIPFQKDVSDSTFRIISPRPEFEKVEMGKQQLERPRDTLVQDFLQNNTQHPIQIKNIEIRGTHNDEFNIVSGLTDGTVEPDSSCDLEFNFTPSQAGPREAEIAVITPTDTLSESLTGIGISSEYEIPARYVDMGKLPVFHEKDTIVTALRNTGEIPLTIADIYLSGSSMQSFEIDPGDFTSKIKPGDETELTLVFTPKETGRLNANLNLIFHGMDIVESINILGEGTDEPDIAFKGRVLNKKDSLPLLSEVQCFDLDNNTLIDKFKTDKDGMFDFRLQSDKQYRIVAEKENFALQSLHVDLTSIDEKIIEKDIYISEIDKGAKVTLDNVFFDFDKATLKSSSYGELNQIVHFLKENGQIKIRLEGHADSKGTQEYNLELSNDRAEVVKNYLIDSGITKERVETKGFGETIPVADNKAKKGRRLNRRVEFVIIDK
ncbi:MAG: OmpA family protein [Bacteroidales bacterium]